MNKKAQAGIWITLLMLGLIAIVSITVVFGQITAQSTTTAISDEQYTVNNASCVILGDECLNSITSIANATDGEIIGSANYTICNSGAVSSGRFNGFLLSELDNYNGELVNVSYNKVSCTSYSGLTKTIVNYIPLLMAVVLLIGLAVYIKQ